MSAELTLVVEAPAVIVIGAPIWLSVTVANPRPERTYTTLPPVERFGVPPPVEFVLAEVGAPAGEAVALPVKLAEVGEGPPRGMALRPGESRTSLFDLSELHPPLRPSRWRLAAHHHAPPLPPTAAVPVELEAVAPSQACARALAALRGRGGGLEPSWNALLLDHPRTIEDEALVDLDAESRAALAMHLWLHRAVHGPVPVAALDPAGPAAFGSGVLEGEAAVLTHELLVARGDPRASTWEATIVARWPGLRWRIEDDLAGRGLVQVLRMAVGAERPAAPVPPAYSPGAFTPPA